LVYQLDIHEEIGRRTLVFLAKKTIPSEREKAGSRASKDPDIYLATKEVLKTVIQLCLITTVMPDPSRSAPYLPRTVDETVEILISQLSLKYKAMVARMEEDEIDTSSSPWSAAHWLKVPAFRLSPRKYIHR
jgi:hypothetical protein